MEQSSETPAYSTDAPLASPEADRFDRWPFARRVADVLRLRRDTGSLVVGLYGTWGEGKTTTLNFIEHALEDDPNVVVVRFNPWRFGEEPVLIRQFFNALAHAVGGKLTKKGEDFAATVQKYSSALSIGAFGLNVDPEKALEAYSEVDLGDLRERLEETLAEAGLRVVVRVDDIDRLDKNEIRAMFRLVKLSADLEHVAYVLAFDPDVVASALQEQFGSSRGRAGYEFLEKIVTVPLHLPPARHEALLDMCVEVVNEALKMAGVDVEDQGKRFLRAFHAGVLPAIRTPRMAIRYGNAVLFALPILAGEVNVSDQLLVEGMRVVYPELYDHVRAHPATYRRDDPAAHFGFGDKRERRERQRAEVDAVIAEAASVHVAAATSLIDHLFPRARGGHANLAQLRQGKRVAADWYFDRYFSYAIAPDQVADQDFAAIITAAEAQDLESCIVHLQEFGDHASSGRLAEMLHLHAETVPVEAAATLSRAVARMGDTFSEDRGFLSLSAQDYAAAACETMLGRVADMNERQRMAETVVRETPSLKFALNFRGWASPQATGKGDGILSEEGGQALMRIIADRVADAAEEEPLHLSHPDSASILYWAWSEGRSRDEVAAYLAARLREAPEEVVLMLRSQLPTVISSNEEGAHPGDYSRGNYDFMRNYVDPDVVATALTEVYPPEVLEAGYVDMDHVRMGVDGLADVTVDEAAARQFMAIHHRVKEEEAPPEDEDAAEGADAP